mgnify:FL=1
MSLVLGDAPYMLAIKYGANSTAATSSSEPRNSRTIASARYVPSFTAPMADQYRWPHVTHASMPTALVHQRAIRNLLKSLHPHAEGLVAVTHRLLDWWYVIDPTRENLQRCDQSLGILMCPMVQIEREGVGRALEVHAADPRRSRTCDTWQSEELPQPLIAWLRFIKNARNSL